MLNIKVVDRRTLLAGGLALAATPAFADKLPTPTSVETRGGITVTIRDLSPRFLDFYHHAARATPDERFAIWKERYDFAAVPPTAEGDAMARKMLDAAWPRYPSAISTIERGEAGMRPRPLGTAVAVADLLEATRPLRIGVIAYVGMFETNAFTNDTPDGPVVAVPLEIAESIRALLFPHEMTHAVHMLTAKLSPGYERTLGRVVFEEGLAMRVVQRLHPGLADDRYVGGQPWFESAMRDRDAILRGIRASLSSGDSATVFKFTEGQGTTGREREAYIAGWLVLGLLLAAGKTFPDLARIPESALPDTVGEAIDGLLAGAGGAAHSGRLR